MAQKYDIKALKFRVNNILAIPTSKHTSFWNSPFFFENCTIWVGELNLGYLQASETTLSKNSHNLICFFFGKIFFFHLTNQLFMSIYEYLMPWRDKNSTFHQLVYFYLESAQRRGRRLLKSQSTQFHGQHICGGESIV